MKFLARAELEGVVNDKNAANLLLGVAVDHPMKLVLLYRGDWRVVCVPFAWFGGQPKEPNFDDVSVIDSGQTVRLGDFEVAAEVALGAAIHD